MRRYVLSLVLASGMACSRSSGDAPDAGAAGAPAMGAAGASGTAGTSGDAGATGTAGVTGTAGAAGGAAGGADGAVPSDAAATSEGGTPADAGALDAREAGSSTDAPPSTTDAPKLQECASPSIDRLQSWNATMGEGDMTPSGGSLLVKEGDHYVAKVSLFGNGWHVLPVYVTNNGGGGMADLSTSSGFTLTYSTTADLWIQMRPADHWNGGVQWVTKIPSTGGVLQTRVFSLAKESWSSLSQLGGMPSWPYEEARAQVRGFVFVGNTPNTVVFTSLRFDAYVPACRP